MDVTLIMHMFNNINFIRIKTQNVLKVKSTGANYKEKKKHCLSDFAKATQI